MNFCDLNGSGLASSCFLVCFYCCQAPGSGFLDTWPFRSPWELAESADLVYVLHLLKLGYGRKA